MAATAEELVNNLEENNELLGGIAREILDGEKEKVLDELESLEKQTVMGKIKNELTWRALFKDERESKKKEAKERKNKGKNKKTTKETTTQIPEWETETKKDENNETTEITSDKYDKENMKIIQDALTRYDITNPLIQKAILATIAKESWFKPQIGEISYKSTSNKRIREIFGARVSWLSDQQLTTLKNNEQLFRDRVYGPDDPTGQAQKLGNTKKWDGMKYRWRWFNGITFKANYKKYGDMVGEDLVNNPELLEKPEIAAKVNAAYFADGLSHNTIKQKYGNSDWPNDFSNFQTALQAAININAWIGNSINSKNVQQNYSKALAASAYINIEWQA